ncbi:unnamed protein product [Schistosoma mattheei]|uniref:Uncharacterized protein n=1 Tax=Schistosoma mattheei TaxID=31246 RepID=A0AA85BW63_9TREM|nr:unnamed protein product [Schistosoma mattheei]
MSDGQGHLGLVANNQGPRCLIVECRQTYILNVKGCSPKAYNSLINLGSMQLNYFIRYLITTLLSFL